jgi:hypothetical protein
MPIDSDVQRLLDYQGLAPKATNSKWLRLFNELLPELGLDSALVKFIDEEQAITVTKGIATRKTGMLRDDVAWRKWPLNYIHWIEVTGHPQLQQFLMDKLYSFRALGPNLRIFGYGKK